MGLVTLLVDSFFPLDERIFYEKIVFLINNLLTSFAICLLFRDQGEVLAEALKIMLCDDRQHDMQKAAAFVKRLASFSLCIGSAECMAGMFFICKNF